MSRYPEYHRLSALITAAVRAAWPDNRAKNIARALGCAVITGKRIASTGRSSKPFRERLIGILDEAIAANERELRRLRTELRDLDSGRSSRTPTPEYPLERVAGEAAEKIPGLD